MNDSFFYALKKINLVLKSLKEVLRPRIHEKLGVVARFEQMFLWTSLLVVVTKPIADVSLILPDIAGINTVAGTFWLLVGVCAVAGGILSIFFLLISVPAFLLWGIIIKINSNRKKQS